MLSDSYCQFLLNLCNKGLSSCFVSKVFWFIDKNPLPQLYRWIRGWQFSFSSKRPIFAYLLRVSSTAACFASTCGPVLFRALLLTWP